MLISVECELPAVDRESGKPLSQASLQELWQRLISLGWKSEGIGVSRILDSASLSAVKPEQAITSDTGPTIELAPSPALTIQEIDAQTTQLREIVSQNLLPYGGAILASGVHPVLGNTLEEYYEYRSPRKAYDYAIEERGWSHNSILNVASTQEVIDVPIDRAVNVMQIMQRLTGVSLFLFRNDPDFKNQQSESRYSVRPQSWRSHVFEKAKYASDKLKMWMPQKEMYTWDEYLSFLWDRNPMFLLGTKNNGLLYVPDHPTFWEYLTMVPEAGWKGRTIFGNEDVQVYPEFDHVAQTDWTYMGVARLRWKWNESLPSVHELIEARKSGVKSVDQFLYRNVQKVMLEHRVNATGMRGEEMASLAFVTGLLSNLDEVNAFVNARWSYSFWQKLALAAESQSLNSIVGGISVATLLLMVLELSRDGLVSRGFGEEAYLEPLFDRVRAMSSPSELSLSVYNSKGLSGLLEFCSY